MMKASAQRRRSRAQVLEDKLKAQKRDEEMQTKVAEMAQMQQAIQQLQQEREQLIVQTQHIQGMFDNGVLKHDENGGYQPVMDPAEREHLKQQNTLSKQRAMQEAAQSQLQSPNPNLDGLESLYPLKSF